MQGAEFKGAVFSLYIYTLKSEDVVMHFVIFNLYLTDVLTNEHEAVFQMLKITPSTIVY